MAGRHYTKIGYCDKQDVSNYLLLDIDSSFDQQIEDWIATAEKQVNNYCNYTTASGVLKEEITGETAKAFVDTEMSLKIFPRKTPIQSISSLSLVKGTESLDLQLETGDNEKKYTIPTHKNFIVYPDYELTVTGASIINSFAQIRNTDFWTDINYIAGYEEVPEPVRQATINYTADIVMRHVNKEGLESISQGRITKRWRDRQGGESDFIKDAETLLMPYRQSGRFL